MRSSSSHQLPISRLRHNPAPSLERDPDLQPTIPRTHGIRRPHTTKPAGPGDVVARQSITTSTQVTLSSPTPLPISPPPTALSFSRETYSPGQSKALRGSEPLAAQRIDLVDTHCAPDTSCLSQSCLPKDLNRTECRGHRRPRHHRSCPSLAKTLRRLMMADQCDNPRDIRQLYICLCRRKRRI